MTFRTSTRCGTTIGPRGPSDAANKGEEEQQLREGHPPAPPLRLGCLGAGDRHGLRVLGAGLGDHDGVIVHEAGQRLGLGKLAGLLGEISSHLRRRLRAKLSIALGRRLNEAVEARGQIRDDPGGRRNPIRQVLVGDGHRRLAGERQASGQQLEGEDPDRVQVAARISGLPADLLGGQVLHRPRHRAGLGRRAVGVGPGEAEVGHLGRAIRRDDDVLRLDVAVHDALAVRVIDRGEDLPEDVRRLRGREPPLRREDVPQARAPDELHHHVVDAVDRAPVVHGRDVRVIQHCGRASLPAEPVDEPGVARERAMEDLDRHLASQHGVVRAEHLAHSAGRDPLDDAIAPVEGGQLQAGVAKRHRLRGRAPSRWLFLPLRSGAAAGPDHCMVRRDRFLASERPSSGGVSAGRNGWGR